MVSMLMITSKIRIIQADVSAYDIISAQVDRPQKYT